MYAPLYIKTNNSLLESMIQINELIDYAKSNGIKALTITDNRMYGVMEFYKACLKNDIKPIIGLEVTMTNKIVLYAMNNNGYKNLLKLSTIQSERELTVDELKKYNDGLICILPYESNLLYDEYKLIYKDIYNSYRNKEERENITNNKKIYMNEVLYINKKDSEYIKYLYGIKDGILV
ncbi:MAG TPA: PHP domain-containing protein, partial [Bacilli bacterium]|nr:PHP domain-containing protein [Bacilli bacterium]